MICLECNYFESSERDRENRQGYCRLQGLLISPWDNCRKHSGENMRSMDNFKVFVRSYKVEDFRDIIDFIMREQTVGFWYEKEGVLYVLWHKPEKREVHPFPTALKSKGVLEVARAWLAEADYGEAPNIDGSCSKGFEVSSGTRDAWDNYVMLTVKPAWAYHHK